MAIGSSRLDLSSSELEKLEYGLHALIDREIEVHPVLGILGFGHPSEGQMRSRLVLREPHKPSPVVNDRAPQHFRPKRGHKLRVYRIDYQVLNALRDRHGARSLRGT
jgi:hypothetical protein